MSGRGAATTLALLLSIPSCATFGGEVPLRVGAAYGVQIATATPSYDDHEVPFTAATVDLDSDMEPAGFLELMLGDDSALHVRATGSQHGYDYADGQLRADVTRADVLALYSLRYTLFQGIALRPLFGIGWHYLEADFDRLASYPDSSGLAFGLAGGAELELSPYVFVGLMGEVGIYGVPGDTHGEDTSLWIYAGVRF